MEPCNKKIFEEGVPVFIGNTVRSKRMEEWVKIIAEQSGQPVDWHFYGGRAIVLALNNVELVKETILKNKKMYNDFFKEAILELNSKLFTEDYIEKLCEGIWNYNF